MYVMSTTVLPSPPRIFNEGPRRSLGKKMHRKVLKRAHTKKKLIELPIVLYGMLI